MTGKRIVWKEEQRQKVAKRSFLILRDPIFSGSEIEAIRQAQSEVLEPALHRDLTSMQAVDGTRPWIRDMWKALDKSGFVGDTSTVIKPLVNPEIERHLQAKAAVVSDLSIADLMNELVKRVTDMMDPRHLREIMREEANAVLDRRMPGVLSPDPGPDPEPEIQAPAPAPKHRVCLIGLDGKQQQIMYQAYRDTITFVFLSGSEGHTRIKNIVSTVEYTVRSRWAKGVISGTQGWPNYTTVDGGMESIHRLIRTKFKLNEQP
jgi:hypothetical protein